MIVRARSQKEALKLRISLGLTSLDAVLMSPSVPNCFVPCLSSPMTMIAETKPKPHNPAPNHRVPLMPRISYSDSVKKKSFEVEEEVKNYSGKALS